MNNISLRKTIVTLVLAIAALSLGASEAFASHFRYGSISWSVPNPSTAPRTVQIRFDAAWRWSFDWYRVVPPNDFDLWPSPPVGMVVTGAATNSLIAGPSGEYALRIMQGSTVVATFPLHMTVTGIDNVADIMTTSFTVTTTLPSAGSFRIEFNECCRLTTLVGPNADDPSIVSAGITVSNAPPVNQQPVAATLPIMNVLHNQAAATFTVPAYDPDGDPLTFSLPTTTESGLNQSAPAGFTLNPATGVVTWNTTAANGTVLNGLYAVQVRVADNKGAYTVVDLLLRPVAAVGQPPTVRINGLASNAVFNVVRNTPMSFTVLGTDPAGEPVTLSSSPRPTGSVMTPSLPTTAAGNVSSSFTWTPPPSAVGTYVITYSAIDGNGLQGTRSATINVTNNPPTIFCTASGGAIEATGPLGALFSVSADIDDADADLLSRTVLIDGISRQTLSGLIPGNTVPYTTPAPVALGNHTYEVRVSDSLGAPVSCTGTFSIVDTTAPSLVLPPHATLNASGPGGAVHNFSAAASDTVDSTPTISCSPASGGLFPVGTTTVTCTATDDSNNSVQGTFQVTVLTVPTSLSPLPAINVLTDNTITMSTTLTRTLTPVGPLAGEAVVFTITRPSGSIFTVTQVTDAAGVATLAGLPVSERGVHTIDASLAPSAWLQSSAATAGTATAYQRTELQLHPTAGVAGAPIALSTYLATVPDGYGVHGESVAFSFAGGVPPSQTATTFSGGASVPVTFADAGVYTMTTTFFNAAAFYTDAAGSLPPQPTVATQQITISLADSAVSLFAPPTGLVGGNVLLSAWLQRTSAPAGAIVGGTVEFVLVGPSPSITETVITASADPAGMAYAVATGLSRGAYTVVARFPGSSSVAPSSSPSSLLSVYQRTTITLPVTHGVAGAPTTLSAELIAVPQGTPIAGQVVTFTWLSGFQSGVTDASGVAQTTTTFPYAINMPVTATFNNVADFYADASGNPFTTSDTQNAEIVSAQTALTPLGVSPIAYSGIPVDAPTTLSRISAPAGPIANEPVTFTVSGADGPNSQTYTVTTAVDGSASASLTLNRGVYTVVAGFPGTQALSPATTSATVTSWQKTVITLAGASIIAGAPVTLTAELRAVPDGSTLAGQPVHFSFGGVIPDADVMTGPTGLASVTVTFPMVGTFPVSASFENDVAYYVNHLGQPDPETATAAVVVSDPSVPVITPTVSGTLGSNGWYTSDVVVSWNVTDPETAISSSTGCVTTTITTDGASFSFTCTATSGGGTSSASVAFKRDATAPTQTLPANITVPAVNAAGAPVTYPVTRNDNLSGVASAVCEPASGATFAIGATMVNCSVTDGAGLTTSGSFTVTVTDTQPPAISGATPSQASLWPPDHRLVPITIGVAATDNVGAPVCSITSITSNEPQNGLGDGDTPNDWLITGPLTAQVRAERAGNGNGRAYTFAIRCVDAAGNAATTSTTVSVPKSQKK